MHEKARARLRWTATAFGIAALVSLPMAPVVAAPAEVERSFVISIKPSKADSVRTIELAAQETEGVNGARSTLAQLRVRKRVDEATEQVLSFKLDASSDVALRSAEFVDLNFDGYKDFWVVREFGAKWLSYEVFMFDAKAGRFVKDAFAKAVEKLANPEIDASTKTIVTTNLGPAAPSRTVRKVAGNSLRVLSRCVFHNEDDVNGDDKSDGILVLERLVKGVLAIVEKRKLALPSGEDPCKSEPRATPAARNQTN